MATNIVVTKTANAPSPITGGWLPEDPELRLKCLRTMLETFKPTDPKDWHEKVKDLQAIIEDSAALATLFTMFFEEIPFSHRHDAAGKLYEVRITASLCSFTYPF